MSTQVISVEQSGSSPVVVSGRGRAALLARDSHRLQKLTAQLDRNRKVTTEGVDSTMEAYVAAIGWLYRRTRAAKRQGLQLPTFLATLRDEAMHRD